MMQEMQSNCDVGRLFPIEAFNGGSCLLLTEFSRPILKMKLHLNSDLLVMIIYKYTTIDKTFDESKLMIIGHTSNSVKFGYNMSLRFVFSFNICI